MLAGLNLWDNSLLRMRNPLKSRTKSQENLVLVPSDENKCSIKIHLEENAFWNQYFYGFLPNF
jgi:hypothetical protein